MKQQKSNKGPPSDKFKKRNDGFMKHFGKKPLNKEELKKMRSEGRRLQRMETRNSERMCFNCRRPGHKVADCPESRSAQQGRGSSVCFKCGASDHRIGECLVKVPEGKLPFALCFVCKEAGHISRDCPLNEKGVYPNGGCCNVCGSVKHLSYNCPDRIKAKGKKRDDEGEEDEVCFKVMDRNANPEDDDSFRGPRKSAAGAAAASKAPATKKVVKF